MKLLIALVILIALTTTSTTIAVLTPTKSPYTSRETSQKSVPSTPIYANKYFDVSVRDAILYFAEGGGSVTIPVTLQATHLNSSEKLLFKAYISVLSANEYTISFVPSSVMLSPGESASTDVTITIPSGVQNGTYAVSIQAASGNQISGGWWIAINVGSQRPFPPP